MRRLHPRLDGLIRESEALRTKLRSDRLTRIQRLDLERRAHELETEASVIRHSGFV